MIVTIKMKNPFYPCLNSKMLFVVFVKIFTGQLCGTPRPYGRGHGVVVIYVTIQKREALSHDSTPHLSLIY